MTDSFRLPIVSDFVRTTKDLQTIDSNEATINLPAGTLCQVENVDYLGSIQGIQFTLQPLFIADCGLDPSDIAPIQIDQTDEYPFTLEGYMPATKITAPAKPAKVPVHVFTVFRSVGIYETATFQVAAFSQGDAIDAARQMIEDGKVEFSRDNDNQPEIGPLNWDVVSENDYSTSWTDDE